VCRLTLRLPNAADAYHPKLLHAATYTLVAVWLVDKVVRTCLLPGLNMIGIIIPIEFITFVSRGCPEYHYDRDKHHKDAGFHITYSPPCGLPPLNINLKIPKIILIYSVARTCECPRLPKQQYDHYDNKGR
jgi:hypothetical protein